MRWSWRRRRFRGSGRSIGRRRKAERSWLKPLQTCVMSFTSARLQYVPYLTEVPHSYPSTPLANLLNTVRSKASAMSLYPVGLK